ncbi:MAG: carbon storage regulator [Acidobacteria bacterium]|nr:carbon storage regulator [Acidobacteriota bacterium]
MLVMSRRQGETILIGERIEIVIAHIGRSRVKVGIRAPREMPVVAHEVKLVRDENMAAAEVSSGAVRGLQSRLVGPLTHNHGAETGFIAEPRP